MEEKKEYKNFKQIVNIFYNEELKILNTTQEDLRDLGSINIEPKILYDKLTSSMKIEFKIGNKKMHKIKDLSEFYNRMMRNEYFKYNDGLHFVHKKEMFNKESQQLLDFILKYSETMKIANSIENNNYKYYGNPLDNSKVVLGNSGIDDIFEILQGKEVEFQKGYGVEKVGFINENPQIEFSLTKNKNKEYTIIPNIEIFKIAILKGKKYSYILKKDKLYRCSEEFEKTNLKLLETFRQNFITKLDLEESDLKDLFSIVIPKVKEAIRFNDIPEEIINKYKPKELLAKIFLDFDDKNYLTADVEFRYGENEFNPLEEESEKKFPRNIMKEADKLNLIKQTGFMYNSKTKGFILPDNDKIYNFLSDEINLYMQKFEVLATNKFKENQIRQTNIGNVQIKLENDLLKIDLNNINIDSQEIEEILNKYRLKKKYHRLKNGEFISLTNNKEIEFLDKISTGMEIDYKDFSSGNIEVPIHRALYLNQLLKGLQNTHVLKDNKFKELVNNLDKENIDDQIKISSNLERVLRYYQKIGLKWMKILDKYKFGGILADDMGLGKTIQILAVIENYIENFNENLNIIKGQEEFIDTVNKKKPSLVVSPSSLCLNWKSEANKFTKNLKVLVINGNANERKRKIQKINKYDLIITSYDSLKRDIDVYKEKEYVFRYVIADEAQYLKNSTTQNAICIKQINADTRFALTGTPIENALAELWSIFDFIMPGYLFKYKKFKNNYEIPIVKDNDEIAMQKLKMMIQPFVLRRTKSQVLKELPEKTTTILKNEMNEEQRNIYLSYLARAKQEVSEEIDINGFKKSQMKILALLTRLRQICCHPNLFIENYNSGSSKLEQCMEIIEDGVTSGHKILLFSSYTSMFPIIEKELDKRDIKHFKLTGSTKVDERLELVDDFNENNKIKVFLISLKAGGTGLNLTGADMVIHYDPWWNISAENQATDRAHRIGQKKNVQVYKLITKNTIEEKIYNLQKRKEKLIDNMLNTEMVFANKLSKEEILELFK